MIGLIVHTLAEIFDIRSILRKTVRILQERACFTTCIVPHRFPALTSLYKHIPPHLVGVGAELRGRSAKNLPLKALAPTEYEGAASFRFQRADRSASIRGKTPRLGHTVRGQRLRDG